jgi:hypothetical protein
MNEHRTAVENRRRAPLSERARRTAVRTVVENPRGGPPWRTSVKNLREEPP